MDEKLRRELQANTRKEVFETLELISSEEDQLDYQSKVPIAYVSAELFNSWEDCYQLIKDRDWYIEEFTEIELKIFKEFDDAFELVCEKIPEELPDIHDFIKTPEWKELSNAAQIALEKLNENKSNHAI